MKNLLESTDQIIDNQQLTLTGKLKKICELVCDLKSAYSWVGIYFMNNDTQSLHLGPFVGAPTDHVVIPYGRGICGQVARTGSVYRSDDVSAEDNYIACSLDVRSELVIPIYDEEILVAQLDIDSSELNSFVPEDEELLEELCRVIGLKLGAEMHYSIKNRN